MAFRNMLFLLRCLSVELFNKQWSMTQLVMNSLQPHEVRARI